MKSMKSKILLTSALVLSIGAVSTTSAQGVGVNVNANSEINTKRNATNTTKIEVKGNATSSNAQNQVRGNATSSVRIEVKGNATSTKAKLNAETHGSAVVAVVKALLAAANRDGGIGTEVRLVAQSQNDSASTTMKAMEKLEKRGLLMRLLFGSDYKNIGQLRSEMAKTENDIDKLANLALQATNAEVKAELLTQIEALKNSQIKMEAFVKANESSFSLFGWLKRD